MMAMSDLPTLFADITPVPQNEGKEPPVCSIAYAPEFVEAHDYLRALLRTDERSKRALDLTTLCLKMNPANYTVWHYRRRILISLSGEGGGIDDETIEKDLAFADDLGGSNPKNYQLWYHRRALLEIRFGKTSQDDGLEASKKELDYVDRILDDDSKNYHVSHNIISVIAALFGHLNLHRLRTFSKAWSHRQWIIRTMNSPELWKSEVDYSHSKILADPRNNSAWSQRWFATHKGQVAIRKGAADNKCSDLKDKGIILSLDMAGEEVHYAICGAELDPYNESPWRYLIGVLMEQWRSAQSEGNEGEISKVKELIFNSIEQIREMKQSLEDKSLSGVVATAPCVSLISALVDLLEVSIEKKELLEEASTLCRKLAEIDPVRRKYWHKREQGVMNKIAVPN